MVDNQTLLAQYFDTAFAAPEGIKRLREFILSLAMRGKLVPQNSKDQHASELLREIEAEKKRLIEEKKIKRSKALPEITPEEFPYDLPESWEWVRLDNFGIWKSGSTPSRTNHSFYDGNIPWVKSGEVKQGIIYKTDETISIEALNKCSLELNPIGSVLIAMYGANIGEVGILEIEAATNQAICACHTFSKIYNCFLSKLLLSLKQNFIDQGAGAAQPNISRIKIINTVVPLPPLEEQKRIVEKIDRLFKQVDRLEQLRSQQEQQRLIVHAAASYKLLHPQDEPEFKHAWRFIQDNFGHLYAVKENVSELRKAILQLAVMGKLVPQDPTDPPASELLKEIEIWKSRMIAEKVFLKTKKTGAILKNLHPYKIPESWVWCYIGHISGSIVPNRDKPKSFSGGFPWITLTNLEKGTGIKLLNNHSGKGLSLAEVQQYNARIIPENSVIMSCVGQFGLVAVTEAKIVCNQQLHGFVLSKNLSSQYIAYVIKSQKDFLEKNATSTTIAYLNKTKCESIPIPLPPLPEQHRIVEKVDRLMNLCDQLEANIEQRTAKQTSLLNAVMAAVSNE
jgi:type I restriction enzyme S subunit